MKYFVPLLILLSLFGWTTSLQAQETNLTGRWEGTLYQHGMGTFYVDLLITHYDEKITGVAIFTSKSNARDFVECDFVGQFNGKYFYFEETKIIREHASGSWFWCLDKGKLKLTESGADQFMKGNWEAIGVSYLKGIYMWDGPCDPSEVYGTMEIERRVPPPPPPPMAQGPEPPPSDYEPTDREVGKPDIPKEENPPIAQNKTPQTPKPPTPKYEAPIKKAEPVPIKETPKEEIAEKVEEVIEEPAPIFLPPAEVPAEIDDRDIIVSDTLFVSSRDLVLNIWDDKSQDGDRISLNLNGDWILENHKVKIIKKAVNISIDRDSYLTLHALNLGQIPPNTAAISIDDGRRIQTKVLRSDMRESATIILKLREK